MAKDAGVLSLAVLIDADNTSARHAHAIFEEIVKLGEANVRRIYDDFSGRRLSGWNEAIQSLAILQHQQRSNTTRKNAGDIALVIDAMDLMHKGQLDGFCLVSSDSDFTRLAQRLREDGPVVYGFGERKTPEAFRNACNRFHVNCVVVFTKYKEKKVKWWTCGKFFTNGVWYMNNMAECLKYALKR